MYTLLLSFFCFFFFNDTATTEIYTLSLHDALPIYFADQRKEGRKMVMQVPTGRSEKRILKAVGVTARLSDGSSLPEGTFTENISIDRKSTRLNSSHSQISYAVFCLKKKKHEKHPMSTLH